MGCCSSQRPKPNLPEFTTVNLPEIQISMDDSSLALPLHLTLIISEIKLTKLIEKIASFPCALSLQITSKNSTLNYELGDIWNYVHEFSSPTIINLSKTDPFQDILLSLICSIENTENEIGFSLLELCAIDTHFKGILGFTYRCLNSAFLYIELHLSTEPYEELALSFSSPTVDKYKSQYFPSRDYPAESKKYFTPNFSIERWNSLQKESVYDIVEKIKNPKTQYCELEEFLMCAQDEYVYHTLERLRYFASQSTYASRIIEGRCQRIKEIFRIFANDKLIIKKNLWVVFELARCLEGKAVELVALLDDEILECILKVRHDRIIASLCIEIILKVLLLGKAGKSVIHI